jgi:hypothetical protein
MGLKILNLVLVLVACSAIILLLYFIGSYEDAVKLELFGDSCSWSYVRYLYRDSQIFRDIVLAACLVYLKFVDRSKRTETEWD